MLQNGVCGRNGLHAVFLVEEVLVLEQETASPWLTRIASEIPGNKSFATHKLVQV